jgi:Ala-tRNA(Pro) deacylase
MTEEATEMGMHGSDAVVHFLERKHAAYELIEHEDTFAAIDEARAAGSPLGRMAKTVLLHDHGGFRAAIIPASERLDLHKARELFGASGHLRLANEDEIEQEFPAFDVGALPPFSALLGTPEILDISLLDYHHVLCSGGDHRHTLKIAPREIERCSHAAGRSPLPPARSQTHRRRPASELLRRHERHRSDPPTPRRPVVHR